MNAPAAALRIPSLWFLPNPPRGQSGSTENARAFQKVTATRMRVWLTGSPSSHHEFIDALSRWLDNLSG
jgi:hypothetical protein